MFHQNSSKLKKNGFDAFRDMHKKYDVINFNKHTMHTCAVC